MFLQEWGTINSVLGLDSDIGGTGNHIPSLASPQHHFSYLHLPLPLWSWLPLKSPCQRHRLRNLAWPWKNKLVCTLKTYHTTHTYKVMLQLQPYTKNSLAFFFKLPFWLLRLVKPCSVKRFFDSTEHSEVELVLSTMEERDRKKGEKAMKRSRQKVICSCAREPAC